MLAVLCVDASIGKIRPLVDSVYEFEDALKAYERILSGRATGKVRWMEEMQSQWQAGKQRGQ